MKNLKTILAATLTFITINSISAQTTTQKTTSSESSFGIKGGVNFSNMYTEDVDDENMLTGFNAGIFAELPISNNIAIRPELNYTTKGAELKYDNALTTGAGKFSLGYVELPLLLQAKLGNTFSLHVGPYAAYLVDAKITNKSTNGTFDFENNLNEDDFNRLEAGIAAGLGLDFDNFGIGARYNYGLTTVGKEQSFLGTNYTFPNGKNSVFNIYASIKF